MSLLRDAVFKSYPKLQQQLKLERSKINLKPLKKLTVRFDPFNDGVSDIRKFANSLHETNITKTNPKCLIKTEILTDRSESIIIFDLVEGEKFIFKCANLKQLEILQLMNKYITPLAPKDDLINEPVEKVQKKNVKKARV